MRPFWFWNGKLSGEELSKQIRQMVDHGVFGAYAHNRDGLETPYLSEEWWQVVGAALKTSREVGFSLCMVDEFEWPSGEARDYWLPGINKSRVVAANPEFRMRQLRPLKRTVTGPQHIQVELPPDSTLVVAGRSVGPKRLDGSSLRTLAFDGGAKTLAWDVPQGEWLITTYVLEPAYGFDGGTVDLMNPLAVRKFIEVYYEEFHRRYGEYFGNAMPATFADHEGTYGGKLAWTPQLFEAFKQKKGYDLVPLLPVLSYDGGPKTEKIRCDYQDVISHLYSTSFFKQVNDWCAAHKLDYSGHVWEESLFFGPAYQGDFYRHLRALGNPGCDSLAEWGRQSVWLKEVASVADFEGRRVVCENQGVQGGDSCLSLEAMRRVSNCLGAWNVGEFIPHAFDYDLDRLNFPPDWFRSQPFLPYFRAYADLLRRISFMNCDSQHIADTLLYYPQVSIWGQSGPVYLLDSVPGGVQSSAIWSEDAVKTNSNYAELKQRLSEARLDYKVADDSYLWESHIEDQTLAISTSRFRTLIMPPMSTMPRSSAERIAHFYRQGGTVIAHGRLPSISVEDGRGDLQLQALWDSMFDTAPTLAAFTLRTNPKGGRAYFVPGPVDNVVGLLNQIVDRDVSLASGPTSHLYVLHKQKSGIHFYWVVNDTSEPRSNVLRLRATGRPERWDAVTGKREPVFYQTIGAHTLVRLTLQPWDAVYLVFDPDGPAQNLELLATNLDELVVVRSNADEVLVQGRALAKNEPIAVKFKDGEKSFHATVRPSASAPIEVSGKWKVAIGSPTVILPYAGVKDDPGDRGLHERWFAKDAHFKVEDRLWLSPMNWSIRQWNVIGPFPNRDDRGLEQSFPPEHELDFEAAYEGDGGRDARWLAVDNDEPRVAPEVIPDWNWAMIPEGNGRYAPNSNILDYGQALKLDRAPAGTIFAQTNIYVSDAQQAVVVLATSCPAAAWMNGQQVHSRWLRPAYNELKDGFALRIPVRLNAGWNSLLLKFLHNPIRPTRAAFTCRIENADRTHLSRQTVALRQVPADRMRAQPGFRWLYFQVPPHARAIRVPALDGPWWAYVDGVAASTASEIPLAAGARQVVLRVSASEILDRPFELVTAPCEWELGTWSVPGLEHYSGAMIYEKTVDVPASMLKTRVLLDCGQVGVCAEAWVNDIHVGARPWQPFVFEVSDQLRPGPNRIKVRVTNTEGNARAVGDSLENLKRIDVNGWLGPARLVPYVECEIRCARV
jgi:hypothetical protein